MRHYAEETLSGRAEDGEKMPASFCSANLEATEASVGSNHAFYLALGFHGIYTSECWVKCLGK